MKYSQLRQIIKEEIRKVLNENESTSQKINGKLLYDLLSSYNEFIGGHDEEIYEICGSAQDRISENKWYTVSDVVNLDSKNKNIICGGVLVYAFSMDSEIEISNNYFKYYEKGNWRIEGRVIDAVDRGFFYKLASKIDYNPTEWYRIVGDENFDAINGILNKQGIDYKNIEDYKNRDINKLITKGKIGSVPTPMHMGEDLEVELASLRAKK
jgi:hypothetical protein